MQEEKKEEEEEEEDEQSLRSIACSHFMAAVHAAHLAHKKCHANPSDGASVADSTELTGQPQQLWWRGTWCGGIAQEMSPARGALCWQTDGGGPLSSSD